MEFNLTWILLGLPVAFVLGWMASRWDLRQVRADNRQAPRAYFKGLNFLLNEQQDKAIDAFIEAVQNDPDTTELHFALGNLFRRRGEYNRAVRVHEHLLSRADLSRPDRDRAQHALAQDFLKAGLLDRAEEALNRLEGTQYEGDARLSLLAIYERSRDWVQAAAIVRKMQAANQGDFSTRLAHYLCEDAQTQVAHGQLDKAFAQLQQALETAPQAPRPRLELAQLQHRQGQSDKAWASLQALAQNSSIALPLAASLMVEVAETTGEIEPMRALLLKHYEQQPSLDLLQALVALDKKSQSSNALGRTRLVEHLQHEPSLVAAAQWLEGEILAEEQYHSAVQKALNHATKPLTRYRCAACGFEARTHFWHCPGCQSWDSYPARRVEEL
ncbi:MAG: lipopolysaccharide assembly protein LapB [Comamonas sp.]|jgi:lipopolysaccharide biosynthesis regulator YciM|uniref:lipopolysaccharide assembly protein LapB n=1 Tax=Comamonas sp. TaxID=34028 RepID=UPI002824861B|nr:lipopolysaccharide assembly protein LapB [Comamonas sp.]MDR0215737.1 lipopolysaccharide assembly protein LapB [Comamonas sp.]